jgi:hexosaminidase
MKKLKDYKNTFFLNKRKGGFFKKVKSNKVLLCLLLLILIRGNAIASKDPDSLFHTLGYSIIPTPQWASLSSDNIIIDDSWQLLPKVGDDISVTELIQYVEKFRGVRFKGNSSKKIILAVEPGTIKGTADSGLNKQGYLLKISPEEVKVTGNSKAGLFYGVQSLLQLFKKAGPGQLHLPEGEIRDWPDIQLRFVHWDTKHHLDKIEALKQYLDRLARVKINMVAFEIWDKFRFPTDPEIGVKDGFTPAQLQELVNYGLERHIQIVPDIQAPAHMQWLFKLKKYAHLKADVTDQQACMCDPEFYKLLFSLYQDIINATKGVNYFFVSTDEVYNAGICKKCGAFTPENRSLAFVDFVNKAHDYLAKYGRRALYWGEWPLMPEHIKLLPPDMIEGNLGASYFVGRIQPVTQEGYIKGENERGIRQLLYTSQSASLAPVNFGGGEGDESIENFYNRMTVTAKRGHLIGSFAAGWDDLGPHSELYWLGWTASAAYSWNQNNSVNIERFVAEFLMDFYGPRVRGMVSVYQDLDKLATFWNRTWEKIVPSVPSEGSTRPSYGNSVGKYPHFHPLSELTLPAPALPFTAGLNIRPIYSYGKYYDWVLEAKTIDVLASSVLYKLEENRLRADHNDYNFRVLITLAKYMRHHARLFENMYEIENNLQSAEKLAASGEAKAAVESLLFAHRIGISNIKESEETITDMKNVFSETRVPGYLTLEQKYFSLEHSIGLQQWLKQLSSIILEYATKNDLSVQPIKEILDNASFSGEAAGE